MVVAAADLDLLEVIEDQRVDLNEEPAAGVGLMVGVRGRGDRAVASLGVSSEVGPQVGSPEVKRGGNLVRADSKAGPKVGVRVVVAERAEVVDPIYR